MAAAREPLSESDLAESPASTAEIHEKSCSRFFRSARSRRRLFLLPRELRRLRSRGLVDARRCGPPTFDRAMAVSP